MTKNKKKGKTLSAETFFSTSGDYPLHLQMHLCSHSEGGIGVTYSDEHSPGISQPIYPIPEKFHGPL